MNKINKTPGWLYTLGWEPIQEANGCIPEGFTGIHYSIERNSFYRLNGKRHRLDGPAIEHSPSTRKNNKLNMYYIHGERIDAPSPESFKFVVDIMKLKGML